MSGRRVFTLEAIGLAALLGATLWVFWGSLGNPFHFDDSLFLENPKVTDPGDVRAILRPTQIRPLTYLTFLMNYRAGGTDPRGYHRLNLILHLATVVAVFWLARLLVARSEIAGRPARPLVPLAAAAIFALHPVQTESVNYVYQRSTLLAGLFGVLALCLLVTATRRGHRGFWLALAGVAAVLAVAGKESAVAAPVVFTAYLMLPVSGTRDAANALRRTRRFAGILTLLVLAAGLWTLFLLDRFGERTSGLHVDIVDPVRYFLSQLQVIPRYLRLLVWPAGLSVDPDPALGPLVSVRAGLCLTLLGAILSAAVALRRRWPLGAFLVIAFFLLLAPTSSLVPSADPMFEHRLYLPMAAVAILMAVGLAALAAPVARGRPVAERAVFFLLGLALLMPYGLAARARTLVWGDNVRLWEDAVAKAPLKARPHYNLGVSYLQVDRGRARAALLRALELRPGHPQSLYNLGWLEQTSGRYEAARRYYNAALAADPYFWQALHNLGNLDVVERRLDDARSHYAAALGLRPDYWPALLNLGTLELQREEFRSARRRLETLSEQRPDLLDVRYLLAYACVGDGDPAAAETQLRYLESRDRDGLYRERVADLRRRAAGRR